MHLDSKGTYIRKDIWREGKWFDLWSVVHFLSGVLVGFALYLLKFQGDAAVLIAFLLFVAYELWEAMVKIKEAPTNRAADIAIGMASSMPTFFLLAPSLSRTAFILMIGLTCMLTVLLGTQGWVATRKAAVLEGKMRRKYQQKKEALHKSFDANRRP